MLRFLKCAQEEVRSVIRFLHVYENKLYVEIHQTVKRANGDKIMDIRNVWSWCTMFKEDQTTTNFNDMQNLSFRNWALTFIERASQNSIHDETNA